MSEKTTGRLCAIAAIIFAAATVGANMAPNDKAPVEKKPDVGALNFLVYGHH